MILLIIVSIVLIVSGASVFSVLLIQDPFRRFTFIFGVTVATLSAAFVIGTAFAAK